MARLLDLVRIYGDGHVYVAPKGTTLPTAFDEPAEDFVEVGYISEDGVSRSRDADSSPITAWGGKRVRNVKGSVEDAFTFTPLEENATVVALRNPGATLVTTAGVTKMTPSDGNIADERAWLLDFEDREAKLRVVVVRGEVTDFGEIAANNSDASSGELGVAVYDFYELYNSAGVAVGA